ncbi:OmpH family outer membrane protein [Hippea alviniae]|uniref:OmpH family outer membrane protein n=1 Tax=Hippea alviniae TaxID=1279027 RepID=UPI0003B34954|nr:OmpH family outer membrane protein [Hippea alviniae]
MKRVAILTVVVCITAILFSMQAKASNIAFVNLRQILQESQAGKKAKSQIQALIEAKKTVIKRKSDALQKLLKKLNAKNISKAEKDKLKKEYEEKYRDLQMYQAKAAEEVRNKEVEETNKVLKLAINTIKKYAEKHNLDGVFEVSQGNVIYWKDSLNITKTIIKLMDNTKTK